MVQSESGDVFEVLFVCTGNICRSPLAEQLFRVQTLSLSGVISTSSAGTYARSGQAMTDEAARLSRHYGGDPSWHEASELTPGRIKSANLVVTMTREHRAEVVSMVPRASRKTFTLHELDRLIGTYRDLEPDAWATPRAASADALDSFVRDIATMRGFSSVAVAPSEDDIVDPYRRGQEVYDEAGIRISQAIVHVTEALIKVTSSGSTRRDEPSQTGGDIADQAGSDQQHPEE